MKGSKKKIYITIGDPRGIGPEIVFRSLHGIDLTGPVPVVIGDREIILDYASSIGIEVGEYTGTEKSGAGIYFMPVEKSGHPGKDSLNYIDRAIEMCDRRHDAIVTGPVSKNSISEVMPDFRGHTEYMGSRLGASNTAMTFIAPDIKLSTVTTHLPLNKVAETVTEDTFIRHVKTVHTGLKELFGIKEPRILLCSLNPHGGDGGIIGEEEKKVLEPAVSALKEKGVRIDGPYGPDTVLRKALKKDCDMVISLYHDQLLTAVKLFMGPTVNLTMGLQVIRTSPDHGPAFDIAGKNCADPSSMKAAIELTASLIKDNG